MCELREEDTRYSQLATSEERPPVLWRTSTMGSEDQQSVKVFINSLVLLLALGGWSVATTIPNGTITECSVSSLSFEFLELRSEDLDLVAACLDNNGTCVTGNALTPQKEPQVGEQITVTLSSSCGHNSQLTPTDPGWCTLQIISSHIIPTSIGTSVHVCSLSPSIDNIASSPMQTIDMYPSSAAHPQNSLLPRLNSNGEQQHPPASPQLDNTVSIVVPLSLLITFLVIAFVVAIASLIVWTRHAQIKAQRVIRIEEVVLNVSPSVLFGTGDDYLPGDTCTLYEDFDEGALGIDEEGINKTELTLKERLCSSDDASNNTENTMKNSSPNSSLGYQYVAIRTESS